jgi:hypothetical protein
MLYVVDENLHRQLGIRLASARSYLEKQGKNTPGSNIPIVPFEAFELEKPDYILILAWNFKDELIAKTKHLGTKYIIPIPSVEVL